MKPVISSWSIGILADSTAGRGQVHTRVEPCGHQVVELATAFHGFPEVTMT